MKPKVSNVNRKTVGRPRKEETLSFNSLSAAATHIGEGCTIELLKAARKAGCPAFRQNRIYVKELSEWLKNNPVDPSAIQNKESLQIRKLLAECLAKERENSVEEGKLVSIDEVSAINARVDAHIAKCVQDIFLSDALIQRLGGCGFAEMKKLLTEAVDGFFLEINMRLEK